MRLAVQRCMNTRSFTVPCLALAILMSSGIGIFGLAPSEARAGGLALRVNQVPSSCTLDVEQQAWPPVILSGETTELRIRVEPNCAQAEPPRHFVLVVDGSGTMAGQPAGQRDAALRHFVASLDLANHPERRVGVVVYNTVARTLCRLTNDEAEISHCITRIGAEGEHRIDLGIHEGVKVFRQGRNLGQGHVIQESMIVFASGANDGGCDPVLQAARSAKAQGVLVVSVCVGTDCDAPCLRPVATSPRFFYQVQSASGLIQVLERVRDELLGFVLRQLVVVTTLPENMVYIPNSADPQADESPDLRRFEWQQNFIPAGGMTFTLQVRPSTNGGKAVTESTELEFRDLSNDIGTADAQPAWVHVFGPVVWPTP